MFISVSNNDGRYSFIVGDKPEDDPRSFFQSLYDFDLVDSLKSDYNTYAEAHSSGLRLIKNMPSSIMSKKAVFEENTSKTSPEDRVVSHFSQQVNLMGSRIPDIESSENEDRQEQAASLLKEMKAAEDSIKGVLKMVEEKTNTELLEDLLSSIADMKGRMSKYAPVEQAPEGNLGDEDISVDVPSLPPPQAKVDHSETLLSLGVAAAKSLAATHRTAHVRLVEKDEDLDSYFIHLADENGDVCTMRFTNGLLLDSLTPSTRVAMVHPYHGVGFMERYWEPITAAVGHYLIAGKDILVFPGENGSRWEMPGKNITDGTNHIVTISKANGSWWMKDSQVSITKTAATEIPVTVGASARCVKKNLPTYYGRTGMVVKVIPRADHQDIVVDFGRGLGTLVLENSDVQI